MASSDLISRLAALCNNDATFIADDYESLLADHASTFDVRCHIRNMPTATQFEIGVTNLDSDTQIYLAGSTTVLTLTTDYTIDLQRGIFTRTAPDYRPLSARGTTYNLFQAAADAWDRIASRYVLEFDVTGVEGKYSRSQQFEQCKKMASSFRRQAGVSSSYVERGDMGTRTVVNIDRIARG